MAESAPRERSILISIDESENSERAIDYVGRLVGGLPGFKATLVTILEEPNPDIFATPEDRDRYLRERKTRLETVLTEARERLLTHGLDESTVQIKIHQRLCENIAQCILDEQRLGEYGTLVVGRRGLSKSEEFLFGSVSQKLVTYADNCAVWVVE